MYDIDPPARILRLDAPRKGTQPTALTDRQHLARIAQADPIAVRHSLGAAIVELRGSNHIDAWCHVKSEGAIYNLRVIRKSESGLAREFDAL